MRAVPAIFLMLAVACGGGPGDDNPSGGLSTAFRSDQILLALEDPDDLDAIEDLRQEFGGLEIERLGETSFFVLRLPPGIDLDELFHELDNDLRVVSSERDYYGRAPEGGPSGSATLGSELIDAIAAQANLLPLELALAHVHSRGAGVVVAVVDTGIDPAHPVLLGHVEPGGYDFVDGDPDPRDERNGIDDDADGMVDEQYGHGTFVASLVLTVAPEARVLPIRVLDDEGRGNVSGVSAGIVLAVDRGARVINVSIDVPVSSEALRDAIDYAHERGAIVVAAAGNEGQSQLIFPARLGDVVAVAAVDAAGVGAPFTNYSSDVDFVAPGLDMIGAVPLDLNPVGTAHWSGTSFAAPLVTGSIALVAAAHPGEPATSWIERLAETALPVDGTNPNLSGKLGAGLVRPGLALQP